MLNIHIINIQRFSFTLTSAYIFLQDLFCINCFAINEECIIVLIIEFMKI